MNNTLLLIDLHALESARKNLLQGHGVLQPAFKKLQEEAEAALTAGPWSVMDKDMVPPSGDMHDYMSFGTYWWPNPDVPGGEPYIRRDGETNPEFDKSDRNSLREMSATVDALALAYFFTGDERYASRAAHLLRVWFLDEATRMNPHLKFGQAIPGICTGRGIGIIDTRCLCTLLDAVVMLQGSPAWPETDAALLQDWFAVFLRWLQESGNGRAEAREKNNHGTWYDLQVAAMALFVGQRKVAEDILAEARTKRIAVQIEPDGSQPHELSRTRAFTYSTMNLQAFLYLATLADHVGIDLWSFQTPDGRGIRKAIDHLARYADIQVAWPYQQLGEDSRASLFPLLRRAAIKYNEPRYEAILAALPEELVSPERFNLLYPPATLEFSDA